jgi:Outer membrane protein beta-barrel domain
MTLSNLYVGNTLQNKDSIARQDRWVFDISNELWLTKPAGIQNKPYSWGFAFTRMFEFPLSRNFSVGFGLGVRSLHHYHNGSFGQYVQADNSIKDSLVPIHSSVKYKINKTAMNFVDASVDIRIRGGKKNLFKFYVGFRGGYLFNEHLKYKDASVKYKHHNTDGFNKFSYGPTLRVGINNICLYANYLLAPLYENNTKQKIESVSVGITLFFL